jgi:hypothetical protein
MTDLEVCRLSAEALGHKASHWAEPGDRVYLDGDITREWNPLLNAEQRWECVEFLLRTEEAIHLRTSSGSVHVGDPNVSDVWIDCPASEFPARAVAELQKRKA